MAVEEAWAFLAQNKEPRILRHIHTCGLIDATAVGIFTYRDTAYLYIRIHPLQVRRHIMRTPIHDAAPMRDAVARK